MVLGIWRIEDHALMSDACDKIPHHVHPVSTVVFFGIPYSQNIRTRVPTGAYVPTITRTSACLLHSSHPYSSTIGTVRLRGEAMDWKHLLAYITGTVDQEL